MRVAFAVAAALLASPALAADEPVATASQTPAPAAMSTADQIDAYLKSSPALDAEADGAVDGVVARDARKVHGEISVGVGTGGYRSVYVRSDVPVGESGRLSLAFEDTKFGRAAPYRYYGGPYGHPGALGVVDRQRCGLEGMTAERPMDTLGGPHGRCLGRLPGW